MFSLHNSRITQTILLIVYAWINLVAANANCPANPDPCTSHTKLNGALDHTRSSKFYDSSMLSYADFGILEGWYRADARAGGDMPTEAPDSGYCQATYPVWLQGTLPSPGDGIVQRTACVRGFFKTCSSTLSICIKSCNVGGEEYNVYWLSRPTDALSRYCFGSLLQCPDPKQGFGPPCFDYLDNDPVITYSSEKNPIPNINIFKWVQTYFHCNVVHSKTTIYLDFEWSVDGNIIKTHQNVKYTEQDSAKLTPEDLETSNVTKFGINLRCEVRPRSTSNSQLGKSKWIEYYVGFKAVSTEITVAEGGPTVDYIVHTTAPIDCITSAFTPLINVTCSIIVQIVVPEINGQDADCTQSDIANKLTFAVSRDFELKQPCTVELKSTPFVAGNKLIKYTLPVKAGQNGIYDGTKEFALQLRISETIDLPSPWAGMMLPRAQVTVKDRDKDLQGKYCWVYNDPHVKTFDGRYYEMQMEGVFIVYRQITGIPLEVQGYFKRPYVGARYTSVCGIAIRSYGELFVLNHCSGNTFHTKFYQCTTQNVGGSAIKNLVVKRTGNVWTIDIPNGGKVVYRQGSNFKIYPGLSDYKNTEGLCGYLSDICNDDLKLKNSQEKEDDPNCVCGKHCGYFSFYANGFATSWRVNEKLENSLFTGIISDERKFKDVIFCGCTGQGANLAASCTYDGVSSNTCIKQGEDETDKFKRWCGSSRKKRSTTKTDDLQDEFKYIPGQYDEKYVAPAYTWTNGWTEESAKIFCNDFYSNRKAVSLCQDVAGVNVNASKESCIQDIYISGTTNYSLVAVDNIVSQCQTEIQKNRTLFATNTTNSNGTEMSFGDLLLSSLCPNDCSDHGTCENGKCMCEDDYTSVDCSEDKHHVTELKNIPFESVCDVNVRKCQESIVYGDRFIESENLTCRTQAKDMNGTDVSGLSYFKGRYEHFQKILCPLFKTLPPYMLNIAVSNDNLTFSNPKPLLVFDSNCWNCSVISGCTKKESSCVIQEICYEEGVMNPLNSDEICSPKMSQYRWTSTLTSTANPDEIVTTKLTQLPTLSPTVQDTTTIQETTSPQSTTIHETTTQPPTTIQDTSSPLPSTIQETTTHPPTTVQETTTALPTTIQKTTTQLPTTIQDTTTTHPPTTIQQTTTHPPTTIQETTSQPSTIIQVTTTQPPTTVQETTTHPPTTIQETTSPLPTTIQETTTQPQTTMQETTSPLPTTIQETTTQPPTTIQETTSPLPTTIQETTTQPQTTMQETTSPLPTTIQETTTQPPTTIQETTSPLPTTIKETTSQPLLKTTMHPPTTIKETTLQPPTTMQETTTHPPTTIQEEKIQPPTTVQETTTQPTTTIQETTSQPPTTVQETSKHPSTTMQETTTQPTTTIQDTKSQPPTTIQETTMHSPTTTQETTSKPLTTLHETTKMKQTTVQEATSKPPNSMQETVKEHTTAMQSLVILTNDPSITYSSKINPLNTSFAVVQTYFHCSIEYSKKDIFLNVKWLVNGKVLKTHDNVPYGNQSSIELSPDVLLSNKIKFETTIRCQVTPMVAVNSEKGTPRWTDYYVGLRGSTSTITLEEGSPAINYAIKPTVPLECVTSWPLPLTSVECSFDLKVNVPEYIQRSTSCGLKKQVGFGTHRTTPDLCIVTFKHKPFVNGSHSEVMIPIKAVIDGVYDSDNQFSLHLLASNLPFSSAWSGASLTLAQITVVDRDPNIQGKYCMISNIPHVRTFDGRYYEFQHEGVFVIYKQISGVPIEVQGYFTRPYTGATYTSLCGVAIRSYGELYIIDGCKSSFRTKFYQCATQNVGGVSVKNLKVVRNGKIWTIMLPTGGKVVYHLNGGIAIYPQLSDYNNTAGLCGYLSDFCQDDLQLKDSNTVQTNTACACDNHCGLFSANMFSTSWRVNETIENSLFTGTINDNRKMKDVVYCWCDNSTSECSLDSANNAMCATEGVDETYKYQKWCNWSRRKRAVDRSDNIDDSYPYVPGNYDVNFVSKTTQWINGWTEDKARAYCQEYYNKRESVALCKDVAGVNVNASIETCIQDIQITGTTNNSIIGVNAIISQCGNELVKNTTAHSDLKSVTNLILSMLCPNDCNDKGSCVNGTCVCEHEYTGNDCSENKHHVPRLSSIPFGALCDVQTRLCQFSPIYADLFIHNENLTCKSQVLNVKDQTVISGFTYSSGTFEHFQKVMCLLPSSTPPYLVGVAVSNDNETFSNTEQLLVYDSVCWNCSVVGGCSKKMMSCLIESICYGEGAMNPRKKDEVCNPQLNQFQWSFGNASESQDSTTISILFQNSSVTHNQTANSDSLVIGIGVGLGVFVSAVILAGVIFVTYQIIQGNRSPSHINNYPGLPHLPRPIHGNQPLYDNDDNSVHQSQMTSMYDYNSVHQSQKTSRYRSMAFRFPTHYMPGALTGEADFWKPFH